MTSFAIALLLCGNDWSSIDDLSTAKAAKTVRARMLFLSEGMTEVEVLKFLGLTQQSPECVFRSNISRTVTYRVGQFYTLALSFSRDCNPEVWAFRKANLYISTSWLDQDEWLAWVSSE